MTPYHESTDMRLFHGDALTVARALPDASVRTIVTSPPYFGLRDYGERGQIGSEGSLAEYVDRLVVLFRELRRVLSDDGTLWLNLGDSYGGDRGNKTPAPDNKNRNPLADTPRGGKGGTARKQLLGAPWRVALALQADGWILRSDIIWHKPNPMPESVTDRPTKSHEYLFLFAKSPSYYYDHEAIAEEAGKGAAGSSFTVGKTAVHGLGRASTAERVEDGRRNKRTVWTVPTVPFPGSHFAAYPPELIRPCIRAGSRPGDTVLDPFSGSGTTGAVATFEGRKYIGIDLSREYLDLSLRTRFAQPTLAWETK